MKNLREAHGYIDDTDDATDTSRSRADSALGRRRSVRDMTKMVDVVVAMIKTNAPATDFVDGDVCILASALPFVDANICSHHVEFQILKKRSIKRRTSGQTGQTYLNEGETRICIASKSSTANGNVKAPSPWWDLFGCCSGKTEEDEDDSPFFDPGFEEKTYPCLICGVNATWKVRISFAVSYVCLYCKGST